MEWLSPNGHKVVLTRVRPAKNERRFYAVAITTDLFGNTHLLRNWGRLGTGGRLRFDLYDSRPAAQAAGEKLLRAKQSRGYTLSSNGS